MINSVQHFCEVAVLLLIHAAFVTAALVCARAVSAGLRVVNAASVPAVVGRELRRRIVGTTSVVLVAFVIRSVFATMSAVARQLQDGASRCPQQLNGLCDPSCHNEFTHITQWMARRPSSR